jgi:UDP-2-acetamido-3-amino-2,3-dideoxy-glucuronate N-acetyltransferase|tara:strand:+ start:610 stop:1554 length:945 start_codon:yes stop_codon:yes gene_type:complete
VGAGNWGANHIRVLNEMGVLGGIVDLDQSTIQRFRQVYKGMDFYDNIDDSFKDSFDGYIVATPAATHSQIAKIIIQNRSHVLVEKPLALNVKDASELNELAQENEINLMVGHLLLFHPAILKIKEMINDGAIGELQYLYSNRLNLGTIRSEENILWSFAPHDISIFQFLVKKFPIEVLSRGGCFVQTDLHDTTMTVLQYTENIFGHIFVSWLHPFKEHRLIVIGSKGMISFDDSSDDKKLIYHDKSINISDGIPTKIEGKTQEIVYDREMPLDRELQYFVDHLDGSPIDHSDANSAIEVLKILDMATNSLTGKA